MENMDIDTWKEKFKPIMEEENPDCFKEYYRHEIRELDDMSSVWYRVQGDIEEEIVTGYHVVNVDCFYMTEVPHNFEDIVVVVWTEADERERLVEIISHASDYKEEDLKLMSLNALLALESSL
jgi:dephospho-CoA kinase